MVICGVNIFFFITILCVLILSVESSSKISPIINNNRLDSLAAKGAKWFCFLLGLCSVPPIIQPTRFEAPLTPIFEWSQVEFEYNSPQHRQRDIDSGFFIPGNPAIIDSDVYYAPDKKSHVYVTIPRFQNGTPVTLGEVTFETYRGNHIVRPYPSWSWHRNPRQCLRNRLISVFRIQIDRCGRMWVMDTGMYGSELICPPQILAFDLKTVSSSLSTLEKLIWIQGMKGFRHPNDVIYRYELPQDQYEPRSIFVTPIVDVRETCEDTFVYAGDCQTFSIVVYDTRRDQSWRITDKSMYPHPNFGTYNILGDTFDLMDGILGMSISPYFPGRGRKLFFHAMSSDTETWVYTEDIRNRTRFLGNSQSSPEIFHTYKGRRTSQSAAESIDKNGIMYFGVMSDVTLNCWDTSTEYGYNNIKILDDNKTILQFASGVKVIDNRNGGQELFVLTSRFQKVTTGTLNPNEINFRILAGKIDSRFLDICKTSPNKPNKGGGYGLIPSSPFFRP